jgi:hypothetical protein
MFCGVKALRFPFINGGHEVMSLTLKLKCVAFLAQILMSQAQREI